MFGSTAYLYPWDVATDPATADLVGELGVDTVTIAAAYHSVRAATPRHPDHRVVDASAAALYVPLRPVSWAGQRMIPRDPQEWAGPDSYARARDAMTARGLTVQPWVVATHSSAAGDAAPDLCVRNAFGDRYRYALCPNNAEVVAYATTLVAEVAAQADADSMIIEACGPLGVSHLSHHEKTAGADWSRLDETLLSICFCSACVHSYDAHGADAAALARTVREAIGTTGTDPLSVLGGGAERVREIRTAAALRLRGELLGAASASGVRRVGFHAATDPWSTGPAAAIVDAHEGVHTYVIDAWSTRADSAARVARAAATDHGDAQIAAYTTILAGVDSPWETHWRGLLDAGADQLHLYHAGLASTGRLRQAAASLAAVRSAVAIELEEPTTPRGEHL